MKKMAVYSWIYANARMEGNRRDYHVRLCSPELNGCKEILIQLSNRLLSTDRRYGQAEKQNCWFTGFIDDEKYLVAVGGEQETILGMDLTGGGFRTQFCVLGYCFTKDDICLYRKDIAMFEPLKEIMRQIQRTGKDREFEETYIEEQDFSAYAEDPVQLVPEGKNNIMRSTVAVDHNLWGYSLQRPVMTGIISTDDAKKLLQRFPDGVVTVMEDVELQYDPREAEKAKRPHSVSQLEAVNREEERKQSTEALKLEAAEKRRKLEEMRTEREQKQEKEKRMMWFIFMAVVIILLLLFLRKIRQ